MAAVQYKDPSETISIVVDWTNALASGDSVSSATWTVPTGVTNEGDSVTSPNATIALSGGTAGTSYTLICTAITTPSAETLETAVIVRVQDSTSAEPVSLEEVKDHLRIDSDDTGDDGYLLALIQAAREYGEEIQNRTYVSRTRTLTLDAFPAGDTVVMPYAPLSSVTSIAYTDTAGSSQTMSSSDYVVDTAHEPGRICLAYGATWPTTYAEANAVTITYVAGYGGIEDVPERVKLALKMLAAHWYERRLPVQQAAVNEVPMHLMALLGHNRMHTFA